MTVPNVGSFILISSPCQHCNALAKEFRLGVDPADGQLILVLEPCPECGNKSTTLVWHHELVMAVKAEDEKISNEEESIEEEEEGEEGGGSKGPRLM